MFSITSEQETYDDGQIIFEEEGAGGSVYEILSGSVEISKMVRGKKLVVDFLQKGEVFGEFSFMGDLKLSTTAQAVGKTTLGIINQDSMDQEFNRLSEDFKAVLMNVMERFKKIIHISCEFSPRRETRVPKTLAVTYKDEQSFVRAYASDISEGGLFIRTENPLKQGEKFLLNLQLPGLSEQVKIECEAAWTRKPKVITDANPPGMGVKFLEMSENDLEIIKPYIQTIEKMGIKLFEMSEKDNQILKQYISTVRTPLP